MSSRSRCVPLGSAAPAVFVVVLAARWWRKFVVLLSAKIGVLPAFGVALVKKIESATEQPLLIDAAAAATADGAAAAV